MSSIDSSDSICTRVRCPNCVKIHGISTEILRIISTNNGDDSEKIGTIKTLLEGIERISHEGLEDIHVKGKAVQVLDDRGFEMDDDLMKFVNIDGRIYYEMMTSSVPHSKRLRGFFDKESQRIRAKNCKCVIGENRICTHCDSLRSGLRKQVVTYKENFESKNFEYFYEKIRNSRTFIPPSLYTWIFEEIHFHFVSDEDFKIDKKFSNHFMVKSMKESFPKLRRMTFHVRFLNNFFKNLRRKKNLYGPSEKLWYLYLQACCGMKAAQTVAKVWEGPSPRTIRRTEVLPDEMKDSEYSHVIVLGVEEMKSIVTILMRLLIDKIGVCIFDEMDIVKGIIDSASSSSNCLLSGGYGIENGKDLYKFIMDGSVVKRLYYNILEVMGSTLNGEHTFFLMSIPVCKYVNTAEVFSSCLRRIEDRFRKEIESRVDVQKSKFHFQIFISDGDRLHDRILKVEKKANSIDDEFIKRVRHWICDNLHMEKFERNVLLNHEISHERAPEVKFSMRSLVKKLPAMKECYIDANSCSPSDKMKLSPIRKLISVDALNAMRQYYREQKDEEIRQIFYYCLHIRRVDELTSPKRSIAWKKEMCSKIKYYFEGMIGYPERTLQLIVETMDNFKKILDYVDRTTHLTSNVAELLFACFRGKELKMTYQEYLNVRRLMRIKFYITFSKQTPFPVVSNITKCYNHKVKFDFPLKVRKRKSQFGRIKSKKSSFSSSDDRFPELNETERLIVKEGLLNLFPDSHKGRVREEHKMENNPLLWCFVDGCLSQYRNFGCFCSHHYNDHRNLYVSERDANATCVIYRDLVKNRMKGKNPVDIDINELIDNDAPIVQNGGNSLSPIRVDDEASNDVDDWVFGDDSGVYDDVDDPKFPESVDSDDSDEDENDNEEEGESDEEFLRELVEEEEEEEEKRNEEKEEKESDDEIEDPELLDQMVSSEEEDMEEDDNNKKNKKKENISNFENNNNNNNSFVPNEVPLYRSDYNNFSWITNQNEGNSKEDFVVPEMRKEEAERIGTPQKRKRDNEMKKPENRNKLENAPPRRSERLRVMRKEEEKKHDDDFGDDGEEGEEEEEEEEQNKEVEEDDEFSSDDDSEDVFLARFLKTKKRKKVKIVEKEEEFVISIGGRPTYISDFSVVVYDLEWLWSTKKQEWKDVVNIGACEKFSGKKFVRYVKVDVPFNQRRRRFRYMCPSIRKRIESGVRLVKTKKHVWIRFWKWLKGNFGDKFIFIIANMCDMKILSYSVSKFDLQEFLPRNFYCVDWMTFVSMFYASGQRSCQKVMRNIGIRRTHVHHGLKDSIDESEMLFVLFVEVKKLLIALCEHEQYFFHKRAFEMVVIDEPDGSTTEYQQMCKSTVNAKFRDPFQVHLMLIKELESLKWRVTDSLKKMIKKEKTFRHFEQKFLSEEEEEDEEEVEDEDGGGEKDGDDEIEIDFDNDPDG